MAGIEGPKSPDNHEETHVDWRMPRRGSSALTRTGSINALAMAISEKQERSTNYNLEGMAQIALMWEEANTRVRIGTHLCGLFVLCFLPAVIILTYSALSFISIDETWDPSLGSLRVDILGCDLYIVPTSGNTGVPVPTCIRPNPI